MVLTTAFHSVHDTTIMGSSSRVSVTNGECNVVIWSHLSVCLSVCNALTFGTHVYLQNIQVKFICQGHRVKVKVTEAKSMFTCPVPSWSVFN